MSNKVVLIIEDEDIQLKAIQTKLAECGCETLVARNGEEGLKLALEERPDLIILDLVMPKMDGFKVFEELRKDSWGSTAKVFILTNLSNREDEFVNEGNVEYIEKTDVSLSNLLEKVEKALGI